MNYSEILKTYIHESGLSLSQVADQLKDKGFSTDKGYISKLQNGKISPAGEDLNRALADITGGDPDKLTWYAYIEKAPENYKDVLYQLGEEVIPYARELIEEYPGFFQGEYSIEKMKEIEKTEVGKNFIRAFMTSLTKDFPEEIHESEQAYGAIKEINVLPLYKRHLELAKQSLELYYKSSSSDNNFIDSALLISYSALELRLNDVLRKAIALKTNISDEDMVSMQILDIPLKRKLEETLVSYMDLDITKEPFYSNINKAILVLSFIKHGVTPKVTYNDACDFLKALDELIDFIDEKAKEKGIE